MLVSFDQSVSSSQVSVNRIMDVRSSSDSAKRRSHTSLVTDFLPCEFPPVIKREYRRVNNVLADFQRWLMEAEDSIMINPSQRDGALERIASLLVWNHEINAEHISSLAHSAHWLTSVRRLNQYMWTVLNRMLRENARQSIIAVQRISRTFVAEYAGNDANVFHLAVILYTIILIRPSLASTLACRTDELFFMLSVLLSASNAQINKLPSVPLGAASFLLVLFGECCRTTPENTGYLLPGKIAGKMTVDEILKYFMERLCLTHATSHAVGSLCTSISWAAELGGICDGQNDHEHGWSLSETLERSLILNGLMHLSRHTGYSRLIWNNGGRSLYQQQPGPRELMILTCLLRNPDCLSSFLSSSYDISQLISSIGIMYPPNTADKVTGHRESLKPVSQLDTDWTCRPKLSQRAITTKCSAAMVELLTTVLLASKNALNTVAQSPEMALILTRFMVQHGLQSPDVTTTGHAARFFAKALAVRELHSLFGRTDLAGPQILVFLVFRCCAVWPFPPQTRPIPGGNSGPMLVDSLKPVETTCVYSVLCALRCYLQTAMDQAQQHGQERGATADQHVQIKPGIIMSVQSSDETNYADYVSQFVSSGGVAALYQIILRKRSYQTEDSRYYNRSDFPQSPVRVLMSACQVVVLEIFLLCIPTHCGRQAIMFLTIPSGMCSNYFSEQPLLNLLIGFTSPGKPCSEVINQTTVLCLGIIVTGLVCARDRGQRLSSQSLSPSFAPGASAQAEFSRIVTFLRQQDLLSQLIALLQESLKAMAGNAANSAPEMDELVRLVSRSLLQLALDPSCRQTLNTLAVFRHGILNKIISDRRQLMGDTLAEWNRVASMVEVPDQLQHVLFDDRTGSPGNSLSSRRVCPRRRPTASRQKSAGICVRFIISGRLRRPQSGRRAFGSVRETAGRRLNQSFNETTGGSIQHDGQQERHSHRQLFHRDTGDHDQRYFRRILLTANCAAFAGRQQETIIFGRDVVISSFRVKNDGTKIIQKQVCHDDNTCELAYLWASAAMPGTFFSSCKSNMGTYNKPTSSAIWLDVNESGCFRFGRRYFGLMKLRSTNCYANRAVGEDPAQWLFRGFTVDLETGQRIVKLSYPLRDLGPSTWHESYKQIANSRGVKNIGFKTICSSQPCFHSSDKIIGYQHALFDSNTGKFIFKFDKFQRPGYDDVLFHPNGNHVQVNSELWDLRSLRLTVSICGLDHRVMQYSDAGDIMYACDVYKGVNYKLPPYPACYPYEERKQFLDILDSETFENLAKIPIASDITGFVVNRADNCVVLFQKP